MERSGLNKSPTLKIFSTTTKHGHRYGLQRNEQMIRATALVEFCKRNPVEEEVVTEAQWRIREAQRRDKAIRKRVVLAINSLLGNPWHTLEPSVIMDHIVLGGREDACKHEQLYDAGITHVINCAAQVSNYFEGEFVYMKLHLYDSANEDLIPHFQTVAKVLKRVEMLRGRALIHCISGMSRSPALLIAYLMIDKRMRLVDAYNLVRRKRSCVQPNQTFRLQLAKYEMMLFGVSSVAASHDKDWNFYAWNEFKNTGTLDTRNRS